MRGRGRGRLQQVSPAPFFVRLRQLRLGPGRRAVAQARKARPDCSDEPSRAASADPCRTGSPRSSGRTLPAPGPRPASAAPPFFSLPAAARSSDALKSNRVIAIAGTSRPRKQHRFRLSLIRESPHESRPPAGGVTEPLVSRRRERVVPGVHRRDPRAAERPQESGAAARAGGSCGPTWASPAHASCSWRGCAVLMSPARRFSRSR
jgi:hypothetical protein